MHIVEVQAALAPLGLESPDLEILRANEASYACLLLQPRGPIVAGVNRIGSLDSSLGAMKAASFIRLATQRSAHLAVTPEYFFPWATLQAQLAGGTKPATNALWVLGCESIRQDELAAFKHAVEGVCEVIYESCDALPLDRPLLDPVVLLFVAPRTNGESKTVALVQFKTYPSRDNLFLEEALLKRGTAIYRFGAKSGPLGAAVITCSDAFAMTDDITSVLIDRSTLIHIQLNPDPRHNVYRKYRKTAFETDQRTSDCHIVCLNWAGSVVQHNENGTTAQWPAVAGSAWYCPEGGCTHEDAVVLPNHKMGLYYAYMEERRHALLFHYNEAVFELRVPKVVTTGPGVMANRNGPSALQWYQWTHDSSEWKAVDQGADSGFQLLLKENVEIQTALAPALGAASALDLERLLALLAGSITATDTWFAAKEIDSCRIAADEVVRRITVVQDDTASAVDFRFNRLQAAANVRHELNHRTEWPPQIEGVAADARIEWNVGSRHFNIRCANGKPALISYLGEASPRVLENVPDKLVDLLRRAGGPHQKRLCLLFRRFGELKFAPLSSLTRFDDAMTEQTDILAVNTDR